MVKRIVIGVIAALVVALVAGGMVAWVKRDQLVAWWSAPKQHYGDMERVAVPVYFFPAQWAAHPTHPDGAKLAPPGLAANAMPPADVFFVHGSTYFGTTWNADAHDAAAATIVDGPLMAYEASAFNGCCRVFAPRYRQAHYTSIERTSGDGRNAMELAFNDIVRAFDSYVMEENKGRPFILVGHDQGAVLVQRLLDLRIESGTRIAERMVAAYLIGGGIAVKRFGGSFKRLRPCETATDVGCVVAWETFVDGTDPRAHPNAKEAWDTRAWTFLEEERRLCTNPLSWTIDGTADASANLGALVAGFEVKLGLGRLMGAVPTLNVGEFKSLPAPVKNYTAAECRDGFLMVPRPRDAVFASGWRGDGNLHLHDITLFYMNVRQNAIDRVEAFLKTRTPV